MTPYQPVTRQHPAPARRGRPLRRLMLAAACAAAAALIAWGGLRVLRPAHHDYRDPAQLSAAVKASEHAQSADCARLTGNTYLCSVGFSDLHFGTYTVTVAADGSSWAAR